eukprot:EG_transcript_15598
MASPYLMPPSALLTKADQKAIDKFFQELKADNWHQCYHDKDGCEVFWKEDPSSPIIMVKGVIRVNVPPQVAADFIAGEATFELFMKTCDKMCKNARIVETVDAKHWVKHATMSLPPPLWPRDFCWAETRLPDGSYVDVPRSTQHPLCPPVHGRLFSVVRGEIVGSGYWVEPLAADPKACMVHYQVQCDPKGLVPTAVVNLVCKDQGKNVKRLKAHLERF